LRNEIITLSAGDNLISRWIYEISEKEPAPKAIQMCYQKMTEDWVFSHIDMLAHTKPPSAPDGK
jgi:hypothetical protein